MMHRSLKAALHLSLLAAPLGVARADALAGSPASMVHQHEIAVQEDYSFLRTSREVDRLASDGKLVLVTDGENLALSKVSYPYARPEVRAFIERFAASYRAATGSRLVVTSLTRPTSAQPANAHKLSVHPAGMAVDLRVPTDATARQYLESELLAMEKLGVLDVTREHTPSHYHVAVFADAFAKYAARQDSISAAARAAASRVAASAAPVVAQDEAPSPPNAAFVLVAFLAVVAPAFFKATRSA